MCQFCRNRGGFDVTVIEVEIGVGRRPAAPPTDAPDATEAAAAAAPTEDAEGPLLTDHGPDVTPEESMAEGVGRVRDRILSRLTRVYSDDPGAHLTDEQRKIADAMADGLGISPYEAQRVVLLLALAPEIDKLSGQGAVLSKSLKLCALLDRFAEALGQSSGDGS